VGVFHAFEDVGRFGCPNEWLRIAVVLVDVVADRHDQLLDIAEDHRRSRF